MDALTDAIWRREEAAIMNTDPKQSSRPCGCDPGANHTAEGCVGGCLSNKEGRLNYEDTIKAEKDFYAADAPYVHAHNTGGFVTKDSGERQEFESGMKRDTSVGKLLFHLVRFGPMFLRWVSLLTRGAIKYDANNWMKANGVAEQTRFIESADRHFAIWTTYRLTGVNIEDPENPTRAPLTEDHAAAVFFNINGAEYVAEQQPVQSNDYAAKQAAADRIKAEQEKRRIDAEIRTIKERFEQDEKRKAQQNQAKRSYAEDIGAIPMRGYDVAVPTQRILEQTHSGRALKGVGLNDEGSYRLIVERERY
jgi:hypothetical protein